MITNPMELRAQRAITKALVDSDYEEITLTPHTRNRTTTGGFTMEPGAPREPQRFHVVEKVSNAAVNNRVAGGSQTERQYTLLGYWDAEVEVHDKFEYNGGQWEVVELEWDNGYEKRAAVIRFG